MSIDQKLDFLLGFALAYTLGPIVLGLVAVAVLGVIKLLRRF